MQASREPLPAAPVANNRIPTAADRGAPNRQGLFLVSLGHFTVDVVQGASPVLLPWLVADLDLNYAQAAFVVGMVYLVSSVIQPLFGVVSDRFRGRWLLPTAVIVACGGLALAGPAPSYPVLMFWIVVSSLGVAMYHPDAARQANRFAGINKTTGMSLFAVGGNVGFACGPLLMGLWLSLWGRPGSFGLLLLAPVVAVALWYGLARANRALATPAPVAASRARVAATPAAAPPVYALTLLISTMAARQLCNAGLLAFIPLYFVTHLGQPAAVASQMLTTLQVGSIIGTLVSGPLADRFGRRLVVGVALAFATPLLLLFLQATGPLAYLWLFAGGAALVMAISATTVMAQGLLPNQAALAASLTIGLGAGVGGLAATGYGFIADQIGLEPTMTLICLPPLLGVLCMVALPRRVS